MEFGLLSLKSLLSILWGRRWTILLTAGLAVTAATAMSLLRAPKYTATATLIIDFQEPVGTQLGAPLAPALQPNYMATQLGIISSRHVAGKVVDSLDLTSEPGWRSAFVESGGTGSIRDWIAGALTGSLQVVQGANSRLVNISYTAGDPAIAARFANAVAQAYQDTSLELSTQPARREAEHFEQALREQRGKVERAYQQLSAFQADKGILLLDERMDLEAARLKDLVGERIRAESGVQAAASKLRQVEELRVRGESIEALPDVLASEVVRHLKGQIATKQAEFAEIAQQLGANHPRYRNVSAELRTLRASLAAEASAVTAGLRNEVEQAEERLRSLQEAEQAQKTRLLELKQSRDALPALVREMESAQASYEKGLAQANQYQVQSGVSQTNVTLLNPALAPRAPSSPDLARNVLLSLLLGLLLGLGMAMLRELLDRRLRTADDLQGLSGEAFLGVLPQHKP